MPFFSLFFMHDLTMSGLPPVIGTVAPLRGGRWLSQSSIGTFTLEQAKAKSAGPFTFPSGPSGVAAGSNASTATPVRVDPRSREATLDESDKGKFRIRGWKGAPTVKALEQIEKIVVDSGIPHLSLDHTRARQPS